LKLEKPVSPVADESNTKDLIAGWPLTDLPEHTDGN
jgi:hypothetical protein